MKDPVRKIELLRVRTAARGASPAEVEAASMMIGRIIMGDESLSVLQGSQQSHQHRPEKSPEGGVSVSPAIYVRETLKATLFVVYGIQVWVPRSQIVKSNHLTKELIVTEWFYNKALKTHAHT